MGSMSEALELLDGAVDGTMDDWQIAEELAGLGADEELLGKLGYASQRSAGVIDSVLRGLSGNKALMVGVLALLVSAGKLHGYEVKRGDTLWGIAKASGCSVEDIRKLNPQISGDEIKPGQKVVTPSEVKSVGSVETSEYTVKKGDTLGSIAKKHGVSVEDILKANPDIKDQNRISIGDKIKVPQATAETKTDYIAKVLYAETSSIATDEEVRMICRVILNRIGNKAFGGASDAYGVVRRPNAFSCTSGTDGNVNWKEYKKDLNQKARKAYEYAEKLVKGDGGKFPESNAVYYCNKSLAKSHAKEGEAYGYPPGWESDTWQPVLEKTTDHFCFFSVKRK